MSTTIRISDENLNWLKEIHKTPNQALNKLRTGFSDPDTEIRLLNKKVSKLSDAIIELEARCFPI